MEEIEAVNEGEQESQGSRRGKGEKGEKALAGSGGGKRSSKVNGKQ